MLKENENEEGVLTKALFSFGGTDMNAIAIDKIRCYIEARYPEPNADCLPDIFQQQSYSRYAAYEILNRIMDRPLFPASMIIDEFVIATSLLVYTTKDPNKIRIFSITLDVAEDISNLYWKGE